MPSDRCVDVGSGGRGANEDETTAASSYGTGREAGTMGGSDGANARAPTGDCGELARGESGCVW